MRGYFGIGVYSPKTSHNVGSLWRSCMEFDAAFMFTVGSRCGMDGQPSNTVQAQRHIPLYVVPSWEQLILPTDCRLVGVEQCERSVPLEEFDHPQRAVYLLGAEDDGLPEKIWDYCTGGIVHISTQRCLNVAVAGGILMYDRSLALKAQQRKDMRAVRKSVSDQPLIIVPPEFCSCGGLGLNPSGECTICGKMVRGGGNEYFAPDPAYVNEMRHNMIPRDR